MGNAHKKGKPSFIWFYNEMREKGHYVEMIMEELILYGKSSLGCMENLSQGGKHPHQ